MSTCRSTPRWLIYGKLHLDYSNTFFNTEGMPLKVPVVVEVLEAVLPETCLSCNIGSVLLSFHKHAVPSSDDVNCSG